MSQDLRFFLKIRQFSESCQWDLVWGNGQHLQPYYINLSTNLKQSYQLWQSAYTSFYQNNFRARIAHQGGLGSLNPRRKLIEAQIALLEQFKKWLNSEKLLPIRNHIIRVIKEEIEQRQVQKVHIILTCSSPEIEKLPWESWELEKEIVSSVPIRLIRSPNTVRSAYRVKYPINSQKARVLAIFGDQTSLDFQKDLQILSSQTSWQEIKVISWQENTSVIKHKNTICQALADPKGWDILFFAGHSDENTILGGELGIAPQTSISIKELEPFLQTALARGLQFALFNSCNGLSIAHALIDLGLPQIIVMREPIHNQAAQVFLLDFLQNLSAGKDVSDSLYDACQARQKDPNFPSLYLIPSLFSHPQAPIYRLQSNSWKKRLAKWLPYPQQSLALFSLIALSLASPVQEFLLDKRTLFQAIYRDITYQIPSDSAPILLVSIDEQSLNEAKVMQRNPLDRKYLATIIDHLAILNPQVVGVDYLLDRPQGAEDTILAQSLHNIIKNNQSIVVFAAILEGGKEMGILPDIAPLNMVMQGSVESSPFYLDMPQDCSNICTFSYLVAVNHAISYPASFTNLHDYRTRVLQLLQQPQNNNSIIHFLQKAEAHSLTQVSSYIRQRWLQPIVDFSLPPENIYYNLPAKNLLDKTHKQQVGKQVVLIVSGGYAQAGINSEQDFFSAPLALSFWRLKNMEHSHILTGGQAHAYMIHHWLNRHLVTPLPDLWLILVAALLAKLLEQFRVSLILLLLGNILYVFLSLQVYVTYNLVLPILLPLITFWAYTIIYLSRYTYEK
jgi:CHASE2 domain-containing sensor protein